MTSTFTVDRRGFLGIGIGAAATLGLAACAPSGGASSGASTLDMAWWGNSDINNLTVQLLESFSEKNGGLKVVGQGADFDSYYNKLTTQVAGGNAPDVQQHDTSRLQEFSSRGALADLRSIKTIDLSGIDELILDSLTVDGKLVGVPTTIMAQALFFMPEMLDSYGVTAPAQDWTWDDYARLATDVTKAAGKSGFYGGADGSGLDYILQVWLRARGKDMVTAEGALAHDENDIEEWFQYWKDLREAGAIIPADIASQASSSTETDPLINDQSAVTFRWSGDIQAWQPAAKSNLEMVPYPSGVADKAQWVRSGDLLSVYSGSKSVEDAGKVVNFFISDPEVPETITGRLPAKPEMQEALRAGGDPQAAKMIDHLQIIQENAGAAPPIPPAGFGELVAALGRAAEEVSFGRQSPEDGAAMYVAEATAALGAA